MLNGNHINPFKNVKNSISQHPVNLCFMLIVGIRAYVLALIKEMGYTETKGIAFVVSPSASHEPKSYRFGYESIEILTDEIVSLTVTDLSILG